MVIGGFGQMKKNREETISLLEDRIVGLIEGVRNLEGKSRKQPLQLLKKLSGEYKTITGQYFSIVRYYESRGENHYEE